MDYLALLGLASSKIDSEPILKWPHHPDVQSIIRDYSWFRIWQQIKKILNNNYDKSSINYFYFNQSDYLINKNRHFAFSPFCIFAISSAENRSSLLRKVFQPIRALIFWANGKRQTLAPERVKFSNSGKIFLSCDWAQKWTWISEIWKFYFFGTKFELHQWEQFENLPKTFSQKFHWFFFALSG